MSARDWGYAPGDSGYEYPDDGDPHDGIEYDDDGPDGPRPCPHSDGDCVDFPECMYHGCYHRGMWKREAIVYGPDPEF